LKNLTRFSVALQIFSQGKEMNTRLLIVDDHAIVRQGVSMFLKTEPSIEIIGEAEDCQDAINQAESLRPDVILMDLVMPGGDGIKAINELKGRLPHTKIIVLTTFGDENKFKAALKAGADGYLLKDADGEALMQSIQAVQRGDMPLHPSVTPYLVKTITKPNYINGTEQLTEREQEVLRLVAKGLSNQAVAETLHLSKGTVKVHVSNIFGKLQVNSRTEAAMLAVQLGLISPEE
jgi:NarL family two-component system response regulator LiaR